MDSVNLLYRHVSHYLLGCLMNLQAAIGALPGITAVLGSGGKTTLLRELAKELRADGATVVLATSTRILPFGDVPTLSGASEAAIVRGIADHGVVCAGEPVEKGKLSAPAIGFEQLATLADYVLVEADGSKRLPLKAHAEWEPVVPECAQRRVLVVGASGFGKRVADAAHRPQIFCDLAGCSPDDDATPELVARVVRAEGLADVVLVNQAETEQAREASRHLARLLPFPVFAGSIRDHQLEAL